MLMWVVMRVMLRVMRLLLGRGVTLAATGAAIANDMGMRLKIGGGGFAAARIGLHVERKLLPSLRFLVPAPSTAEM